MTRARRPQRDSNDSTPLEASGVDAVSLGRARFADLFGRGAFVALSGVATVAALSFGSGLGIPAPLDATGAGAPTDVDGDGLEDMLEGVLGTQVLEADSDSDLIDDLEELARGSDPLNPESVPLDGDGDGVGIGARQDGNAFLLTTMIFLEDGVFTDKHLRIAVASGALNGSVQFTTAQILALSEVQILPASDPADKIISIQTPFPVDLLEALGTFAVVSSIEEGLGGPIRTAAATTFVQSAGVLNSVSILPQTATQTGGSGGSGGVSGPGLAYKPIAPADQLPETYIPQEVCVQTTEVGGSAGSVVTYVVTSSDCEEADGFCSPVCSTKGGSTIDIVDPFVLVGG